MTQTTLKSILHYNKQTGIFTYINDGNNQVKAGIEAGSLQDNGYICIKINNKLYKSHRLAWLYIYGEFPRYFIDHLNHIRNDNRIINLRDVTRSGNGKNRALQSNNTSGVHGVTWHKRLNKWQVRISINGKRLLLGYFKDKEEAIKIRKYEEKENGYHLNHGGIMI